jgi:hypothetical protein
MPLRGATENENSLFSGKSLCHSIIDKAWKSIKITFAVHLIVQRQCLPFLIRISSIIVIRGECGLPVSFPGKIV